MLQLLLRKRSPITSISTMHLEILWYMKYIKKRCCFIGHPKLSNLNILDRFHLRQWNMSHTFDKNNLSWRSCYQIQFPWNNIFIGFKRYWNILFIPYPSSSSLYFIIKSFEQIRRYWASETFFILQHIFKERTKDLNR